MPSEGADRLRELLGADPPASIRQLDAPTRDELADLITGARAAQTRQLAASYYAALRYVPAPLRRVVRKALSG